MKLPSLSVYSLSMACLVFLSACGEPSATGTRVAAESAGQPAVQAADDTPGLSEADATVLREARKVLAAHLQLQSVSDAVLVQMGSTQWSNGSLGCERPGLRYAQVIIDGHKVVLSLDGVQHHVHMGPIQKGQLSGRVCERLQGTALEELIPEASGVPQAK